MWTIWWVWVVAGFFLGILEVLTPGFIFLGFAVGAVLTGALLGIGFAPEAFPQLLLIFAALSVVAWYGLRKFAGSWRVSEKDINDN